MKKKLLMLSFMLLYVLTYSQMSLNSSVTNISCFGLCDGSATVSVIGAAGTVTYSWSSGSTTSVASNLCNGVYSCTVSDVNGSSIANVLLGSPTPLLLSASNTSICIGQTGNTCAFAIGGTPPYTYTFSAGFSNCAAITPSANTSYTVSVTDGNGCTATQSPSIIVSNYPILITNYLIFPSCGQSNGALSFTTSPGGCSYFTQSASQTYSTQTLTNLFAGNYTVTANDTVHGCNVTQNLFFTDSCDLVWPGDANDDQITNNLDILSVGIGAGVTGTPRIHSSMNWIGQPSQNWLQFLGSGSNYKHIDTDGNGTINLNDTMSVIQNFNLTRPASKSEVQNSSSGLPDLYFQLSNDTLVAGAYTKMNIMLGDAANTLNNVYGVAFTINYNSSIIAGNSFGINTATSWMGTQNTNLISVGLKNISAGGYEAAIVRINQNNISGNGKIGEISFRSLTNFTNNITPTTFSISNVKVINYSENQIAVNTKPLTIYIKNAITGLSELSSVNFMIYPNPANEILRIEASVFSLYSVKFIDLMGKEVDSKSFSGAAFDVDISSLAQGIYFVKILNNGNLIKTQKLIIE